MTRELLFRVTIKDCVVQTMRGSGKGGQNRNKRDTAVRITHPPSGAVGYAEDERKQLQNKRLAFRRMAESPEFSRWHQLECARRLGNLADLEDFLDRAMSPDNLIVEYYEP